jgi:Fic family protein
MNGEDDITVLIKAALLHYQFATTHLFLDGNVKIGRLLIALYLYDKGFLKTPCLYISLFFKKYSYLYCEYLMPCVLAAIEFFLEAIYETWMKNCRGYYACHLERRILQETRILFTSS